MKPARIVVICVAAISAIGLALVVRTMGSSSGQPTTPAAAESPAAPTEPMAKVLVAAKDLEAGSRLTAADMIWKDWAVSAVDASWVTDGTVPIPAKGQTAPAVQKPDGAVARVTRAATEAVTQASKSDFVGAVVRETILAGEPIVARKVVPAGDSGYMAAYLEPGMRAMAIRVTVETAAGGFILPGDRVDVLLTRETNLANMGAQEGDRPRFSSSTVLQNVKVLAIDQSTSVSDAEQAVVGATATLEVRPGDAEALALAKSEGELSLVLRSYADTGGPSGRVGAAPSAESGTVRGYRGGETEVVVVP